VTGIRVKRMRVTWVASDGDASDGAASEEARATQTEAADKLAGTDPAETHQRR